MMVLFIRFTIPFRNISGPITPFEEVILFIGCNSQSSYLRNVQRCLVFNLHEFSCCRYSYRGLACGEFGLERFRRLGVPLDYSTAVYFLA